MIIRFKPPKKTKDYTVSLLVDKGFKELWVASTDDIIVIDTDTDRLLSTSSRYKGMVYLVMDYDHIRELKLLAKEVIPTYLEQSCKKAIGG